MSFEDEWAQIRAEAARERGAETRLNQASGAKGGKKLQVTASVLESRAKHADAVRGNFTKADDAATKETAQIKSGLKGFSSASGLDAFQERWRNQVSYLESLLEHGVAGALRSAARQFGAEDRAQSNNTRI